MRGAAMGELVETAPLFLGVDAGGTKTLAVVVDAQGAERGRGRAGSANLRTVGLEQTLAQVHQAVGEAISAARATPPLRSAWFGMAGMHAAGDLEVVAAHLQAYAHEIHMSNDAELVLGGLDGEVGVALVAGTGSIALGRGGDGQKVQIGGWGHILGDEGSGYDIGRLGLQAAVRAADGRGGPTLLLDLFMRHWRLVTSRDLVAQIYQRTSYEQEKASIGSLAPLVLRAAEVGDATARGILRHAASELSLLAITAIDALGALDADTQPVSLAVGGGLLVKAHELRTSVLARIRRRRQVACVTIVAEPALTAARALAMTSGKSPHPLPCHATKEV